MRFINDGLYCTAWAEQGLGLAYAMEPLIKEQLAKGTLRRVLAPYAASVPGFFLYYHCASSAWRLGSWLRAARVDHADTERGLGQAGGSGAQRDFARLSAGLYDDLG